MDHNPLILIAAFFLIAAIYSSVGFGGGSSYLALLAIMQIPFETIRPAALLCNIVVVTGGTYIFWKEGKLDLKKNWSFMAASIPLAFLGGFWRIEEQAFFILLGISLVVAATLLWLKPAQRSEYTPKNTVVNTALGGGIGLLSGLVGIGGGIFLSPLLHLMNWDEPKKISALASMFILVNSVSGLAGQVAGALEIDWSLILPLLAAVLVGGQIGSRMGARKFNPLYIRRVTAVVIFAAAINILRDHL